MKPRLVIAALLAAALLVPAAVAGAGEIEIGDEANAKMARAKAKARVMGAAQKRDGKSGDKGAAGASCGAVEIGNTVTGGGRAPREVIVVVDGDVINANNQCK